MIPITSWFLLASLPAAQAGSPVTEASKYSLAGRSANVQARQVIELCAGSPVFQRCGGRWCAPPGMYCCGLGACPVGASCLDTRWCCFAGMSEADCRASINDVKSVMNDPSALASMLSRSDVMSVLTASFTGFPAGGMPTATGGQGENGAAPSAIAISGGSGSGGSTSGGGGRGLSTNGQRRRTVDLDSEVELIDEWSTEVSCSPENAGKRTNATGATLRMEIGVDVAGFALSHSVGTDGKLSMTQSIEGGTGGVTVGSGVSMEEQVIPNPTATNQTAIDSGCTISYIWTRGVAVGMIEETVSLVYEFPLTSPAKRQEGAGGAWGRINGITLYSDAADLEAAKIGNNFEVEKGPAAASSSGGAIAPSASSPASGTSSGAGTFAVPASLGAFVAVALFFA